MQKNKRGISGIIVALIMILLALVATGVIWVVIRNVTETSTGNIDLGEKCLAVEVTATKVVNTTVAGDDYDVTVTRSAGGEDIGGIKIEFTNSSGTSNYVHTEVGNIAPLALETISVTNTSITNANKVEVTVYFEDDSGIEALCPQGRPFEFSL